MPAYRSRRYRRYRRRTLLSRRDWAAALAAGAVLAWYAHSASSPGSGPAASGITAPAGASGPVRTGPASSNVKLGQRLAAARGWGSGSEWSCLYDLWTRESGWQDNIANRSSGAFGIAQALGHGGAPAVVPLVRYPDGGTASNVTVNEYPSAAANGGDASAQIKWGLAYIAATYGTPCGAWAHETANSWY